MVVETPASVVPIDNIPSFTSGVLADFCRKWPGTNEARAAKAELISRKAIPYDAWCRSPWLCAEHGVCPRDPNCGD